MHILLSFREHKLLWKLNAVSFESQCYGVLDEGLWLSSRWFLGSNLRDFSQFGKSIFLFNALLLTANTTVGPGSRFFSNASDELHQRVIRHGGSRHLCPAKLMFCILNGQLQGATIYLL